MRNIALLCVFAIGATLIGSYSTLFRRTESNIPSPVTEISGLRVNKDAFNIGDIWETNLFQFDVPITNVTATEIVVSDLETSCGCLSIQPREFSIKAHQTSVLRVALDPAERNLLNFQTKTKQIEISVTPNVMYCRPSNASWVFIGQVKRRITLDRLAIDFGDSIVEGAEPIEQRIMATIHDKSSRLIVAKTPKCLDVILHPASDENKFLLAVRPHADLPKGKISGDIELHMVSVGSNEKPLALYIPVHGNVQSRTRILPERLFLKDSPKGTEIGGFLTLQSPAAGWEYESSEVAANTKVTPFLDTDGTLSGFRVSEMVSELGPVVRTIRLHFRRQNERMSIPIELCYQGIAN